MNMDDIRKHFGSQRAAASALGVSAQVISSWNRIGVPMGRQYEIQVLTGGKLRARGVHKVSLRSTSIGGIG